MNNLLNQLVNSQFCIYDEFMDDKMTFDAQIAIILSVFGTMMDNLDYDIDDCTIMVQCGVYDRTFSWDERDEIVKFVLNCIYDYGVKITSINNFYITDNGDNLVITM